MKKVLFVTSLLALMFPMIASAQTKSMYHEFVSKSACEMFTWDEGNGETYYRDTVAFYISGDTLYVLDLEVHYPGNYTTEVSAGCKYTWADSTYWESTVDTHTFTDQYDCDSIVTLTLTIEDTGRYSYDTSACYQFVWRDKTFKADTVCIDTVQADITAGVCAELHTLNLTIVAPSAGTTSDTIVSGCGFAAYGNGVNRLSSYTTRDTSKVSIVTADGQCQENTLIIHFVINDVKYTPIDTTSCGAFIFLGKTYSETKVDTIKVGMSTENCDSNVVLDLTVYEDLSVKIIGNLDLLPGQSTTLTSECDHSDATLSWNYSGQTSTDPSITLTNLTQNTDVALTATTADRKCSRTAYVTVMVSPYVTGIDEADATDVRLYPNPTSGLLYIESPKPIESIAVYNMAGQKIDETKVAGNAYGLNAASYNNGVYMVSMRMADGTIVNQKIAVKK